MLSYTASMPAPSSLEPSRWLRNFEWCGRITFKLHSAANETLCILIHEVDAAPLHSAAKHYVFFTKSTNRCSQSRSLAKSRSDCFGGSNGSGRVRAVLFM